LTFLPDLRALVEEPNRHRDQDESDASKECRSVLDTHTLEHLLREQWENGTKDASKERVRGNRGGCKLFWVSIGNDVNGEEYLP
jgi:hypothetical protein